MDPNSNNNPADNPNNPPAAAGNSSYAQVVTGMPGQPRKSKKKLLFIGIVVLVLLLAAGGFIFGYYLPNKPENVWKASLTRTGEGLKSATNSATEESKLNSLKRSQIIASAEYKSADSGYLLNFKNTFDENKADGSLDVVVKTKDQPDRAFGLKLLGELQEGKTYPNIYVQLRGLKALGVEQWETMYPGLSEYEGKWIAIEEEYLRSQSEQLSQGILHNPQPTADTKQEEPVTSGDIAAFARTMSGLLAEYVLTADSTKAVIEQRSFVGKEKVGDMHTYHYKAGINKAHAKEFCKISTERINETQLYKKLNGGTNQDAETRKGNQEASIQNCQKSVDNMKQDTFDLWVDTKYKLIHKIRVTDQENKEAYTELGQKYQGGDKLSLFVNTHNGKDKTDGAFTLDTNMKTMETKGKLTLKSTKQDGAYDITATLEAKPVEEEIKIEKPADAVPLKDILERYSVNPAGMVGLQGMTAEPETTQLETVEPTPQYLN